MFRFCRPSFRLRPALVLMHRWVGLTLAGFLLLAGATGSLLAWNDEIDAWINPQLFQAMPPAPGARPLDPVALGAAFEARHPELRIRYLPLHMEPGQALSLHALPRAANGAVFATPPDNQFFIHPYTGAELGSRHWGDLTQGIKNLMPFIYRLHYSLALDRVGGLLMGVMALLWVVDGFVGAYLTFPASVQRVPVPAGAGVAPAAVKSWRARWWPAWTVRWRGGSYKLNVDLHRAGGLWVWAMLFVLAWSSVAFNLPEVYDPVMKAAFAHQPDVENQPPRAPPLQAPLLGWAQARERGRTLMAEQAGRINLTIGQESWMNYQPERGVYAYGVMSSADIRDAHGGTRVFIDAQTGALRGLWLPTGAASGDTIRTWLTSLHMAALWGIPMKLFVCAMGLVVAMLSVTGVVIWWKKRSARVRAASRKKQTSPQARQHVGAGLAGQGAVTD